MISKKDWLLPNVVKKIPGQSPQSFPTILIIIKADKEGMLDYASANPTYLTNYFFT
jgi:hypothetical protein